MGETREEGERGKARETTSIVSEETAKSYKRNKRTTGPRENIRRFARADLSSLPGPPNKGHVQTAESVEETAGPDLS